MLTLQLTRRQAWQRGKADSKYYISASARFFAVIRYALIESIAYLSQGCITCTPRARVTLD